MASNSSENSFFMQLRRATSSFEFEVEFFKSMNLPSGQFISSPTFTAGGCDWSLKYYPQGCKPKTQVYASILLCLESKAEEIRVEYSFGILTDNGKLIGTCKDVITTFKSGNPCGEVNFARELLPYDDSGIMVISCNIRVLTKPKIVDNEDYLGGLREDMEKLLENGERSDVTFEVEGERISAHRFMLAARSPVFETQLFGPMAEAKMEHIKIQEMKPEVFRSLLHFIYTDQLAAGRYSEHGTLSVELLQGLLTAADRYSLDRLILLCEKQLEKNLSVDTVVTTLFLADQHSRPRLKKKCLEFASCPKHFSEVALTEGYLSIMPGAPSLLAELRKKVKCSSHCWKKRKTG